jgi:flagellar assembly factor FliW
MTTCQTLYHGQISFGPEAVVEIPEGLFGFSDETRFLLLEAPTARPIVFVQSVRSPSLCFISMPVRVIEPNYRLSLPEEDLNSLKIAGANAPEIGRDVLCLALLTIRERRATTANLRAPLVINIAAHRGKQVIVSENYSHQHPYLEARMSAAC